jgi:AraC family transcriptional regulator
MNCNHSVNSTLQHTVDFIEENIRNKMTLDQISEKVNMSKYHLNRIFKAITGLQLMNYVRQRKLTCSACDLLNTQKKIIDIACEYGFEYEQTYIRSFSQYFGASPDKFRRERGEWKVRDKVNIQYLQSIGSSGFVTEPSIVIRSAFRLLGVRHRINLADEFICQIANKVGNDFFFNQLPRIESVINREVYNAYIEFPFNDPGYSYYTPSACVPNNVPIPEGMVLTAVPANKYAVFKYIGLHRPRYANSAYMYDLNRFIHEEWFPRSGYRYSAPYRLERIDSKIAREDYCEVELFLPVKLIE